MYFGDRWRSWVDGNLLGSSSLDDRHWFVLDLCFECAEFIESVILAPKDGE